MKMLIEKYNFEVKINFSFSKYEISLPVNQRCDLN